MSMELEPVWVRAIKTEGSWRFFVCDGKSFSTGEGILPAEKTSTTPLDVFWPNYNSLAYYLRSKGFTPPPLGYFTSAKEDEVPDEILRKVPPGPATL
jgi:hypothetical protein